MSTSDGGHIPTWPFVPRDDDKFGVLVARPAGCAYAVCRVRLLRPVRRDWFVVRGLWCAGQGVAWSESASPGLCEGAAMSDECCACGHPEAAHDNNRLCDACGCEGYEQGSDRQAAEIAGLKAALRAVDAAGYDRGYRDGLRVGCRSDRG